MFTLKYESPHEILQHLEVDPLKHHSLKACHLKLSQTFCDFHTLPIDHVYSFLNRNNHCVPNILSKDHTFLH